MLWLRSATELRRAVPRKSRRAASPAAAVDHASSTLMELSGALMAPDEPRTQMPADFVRDGESIPREGEERLRQFLAKDR